MIKLPKALQHKVAEVSDERATDEGIWIYLNQEHADFEFDPWSPMRTIHEHTLKECVDRLQRARKITPEEFEKFPHLKE